MICSGVCRRFFTVVVLLPPIMGIGLAQRVDQLTGTRPDTAPIIPTDTCLAPRRRDGLGPARPRMTVASGIRAPPRMMFAEATRGHRPCIR
jgi:hypothetical protein